MQKTAIVIGYGNDLRSDDAIGQKIANKIESWHLSRVKSYAVHQLTPELAANLAQTNIVIFVDAGVSCPNENVQVECLLPTMDQQIDAHIGDPRSLLALTKILYNYCPQAWLITVPGINFEIGENLSNLAQKGMDIALTKIINIIEQELEIGISRNLIGV